MTFKTPSRLGSGLSRAKYHPAGLTSYETSRTLLIALGIVFAVCMTFIAFEEYRTR